MKKIIVLGGAGFIGTNIVRFAGKRGVRSVVFDNFSRAGSDYNAQTFTEDAPAIVDIITGNVAKTANVENLFDKHGDADAVFHMAGQVAVTTSLANPRLDFEANALGTINVLEAMRAHKSPAPLIFASSNKVYGNLEDLATECVKDRYVFKDYPNGIDESFPLSFLSPYGCSKGTADQYVLDYSRLFGLKTIVFRQSCIYGRHQFGTLDQGWVAWFVISALLGKTITIFGDGKQVRDILFADDLMDAYWKATDNIETTNGQAYNIGGGSFSISLLELIAILEELLGRTIPIEFSSARPGDQKVFICDSAKAKADFGWAPVTDQNQGLETFVAWIRDHLLEIKKYGNFD